MNKLPKGKPSISWYNRLIEQGLLSLDTVLTAYPDFPNSLDKEHIPQASGYIIITDTNEKIMLTGSIPLKYKGSKLPIKVFISDNQCVETTIQL